MFDLGFWELCLIGVVALLVFGPDKLPEAARKVGFWIGRIRRYVDHAKSEIDKELRLEELQANLNKPTQDLDDLRNLANETKASLTPPSLESSTASTSDNDKPATGSTEDTAVHKTPPQKTE